MDMNKFTTKRESKSVATVSGEPQATADEAFEHFLYAKYGVPRTWNEPQRDQGLSTMNTQHWAWRAARATKDAVVGVANTVKMGAKTAVMSFKAGLEAGKEVADMDAAREKYEAHVQSTARLHKH